MREILADISQSRNYVLLEWLALLLEFAKDEFFETVLREVIAAEEIEQLVSHLRIAV